MAEAVALAEALGIDFPLAAALARRGFGDVSEAREFLAADEIHSPGRFDGMPAAVSTIRRAVESDTSITVYGDYDADGVAATAILVGLLRDLGARCDWFIPDRISDGYGLNAEAVRSVAGRGTGLMITVDCGIASPEEVALARELGMETVITDHHQFGEVLPECPILHPVLSGYPFQSLAGAGVAAKLASAVREEFGVDPAGDEADLDLVALATVADVMPLTGENRRLVRDGLKVINRAGRIGMRALLSEAGVEPGSVDSIDLGFRLGPRVNAVGRMYRADAGVELFLTDDPERAAEIGRELSAANAERRRVQQEVEAEARKALTDLDDPDRSVIVVGGEGWHPGVVGIVASHLSRDEGMPAVVIALEDGLGKGSARSVPGVDLHAAISSSSGALESFGGHAAAAGVTVREENVDDFRKALDCEVRKVTGGGRQEEALAVDAIVGGQALGIDLAEQLEGLGPYGAGNRVLSLLAPSAKIDDAVEMGQGKHLRLTLASGGHRSRAVWFGRSSPPSDPGNGFDVVGELSVNHWNGSVEPRFRVSEVRPTPPEAVDPLPSAEPGEWWERFDAAMERAVPEDSPEPGEAESKEIPHRSSSEAVLLELISSGESVAAVTAEAWRRWIALGGEEMGRFGPNGPVEVSGAWSGSPRSDLAGLGSPVVLIDYEVLFAWRGPEEQFDNVVLFDPPASKAQLNSAAAIGARIHRPDDASARSFALAAAAERHDPVPALRGLFVRLREDGPLEGEELRGVLAGDEETPRSPERAAGLVKVLEQAGIGQRKDSGPVRKFGVVSSEEVDLDRSEEFRRQAAIHQEQIAFLRR